MGHIEALCTYLYVVRRVVVLSYGEKASNAIDTPILQIKPQFSWIEI